MTYRIGQEVECIVDAISWQSTFEQLLIYACEGTPPSFPGSGEKFVVVGFGKNFKDGTQSLKLDTINGGWAWDALGFRPVVKTDISVLEDIRRKVEVGALVKNEINIATGFHYDRIRDKNSGAE
jgi:hypothetical protein